MGGFLNCECCRYWTRKDVPEGNPWGVCSKKKVKPRYYHGAVRFTSNHTVQSDFCRKWDLKAADPEAELLWNELAERLREAVHD